jgi:hypothetical protein
VSSSAEDLVERKKQVEEQTVKAGRYYARQLDVFGNKAICARVNGVTMVVAKGSLGEKLGEWAKRVGLDVNEPPQ